MAKLLREFITLNYDVKLIAEAKEKKQPIIVKALLQRADLKNQNGRIYPRSILEREVENYKKVVAESRATGEADHPESSVVELKNVSHIIRDIWWDNNDVVGKVEILNTPSGNIIKNLMEAGVKIGISSRGVGETKKDDEGNDIVDESFMLVAFDLVSEPSTHEAWLSEGKEISLDKIKEMIPKRDRVNRILNDILKD
jgi:hypothetical protein